MDLQQASRFRIISLFEDLSDADLARVARACVIRAFERQAEIATEREHSTDVFFILDGMVRVNSISSQGREVVFNDLGVGDIFGEFAAIDRMPRSATGVALTDCIVARHPRTMTSRHESARIARP